MSNTLTNSRMPIGVSDFKEIIEGKTLFVDKTLFIQEVIEDGSKIILITRPRRFGKTLTLTMTEYFLDIEGTGADLFHGLNIAKEEEFCAKHQGKYPVIFVSFKDIKSSNMNDALLSVKSLIAGLFRSHRYLLDGNFLAEDEKVYFNKILLMDIDISYIYNSILFLSEYLTKYYKTPPVLLIDEYDTPIQEAYMKGFYDDMVELMRGIFGRVLKDNSYITKAILTGIARVSQESMFSDLNNIMVYSLFNKKYGNYFGFLEEEVIDLIDRAGGLHPNTVKDVKDWYNGYKIGNEAEGFYTIYNAWSIINYIACSYQLQPYWLNTSSNGLLKKLISDADIEVKNILQKLIQKETITTTLALNLVFPKITSSLDAILSLMVHAGYLNAIKKNSGENSEAICDISVPNKEVGCVYYEIVKEWFTDNFNSDNYQRFLKTLVEGDIESFKHYVERYLMQSGSYFDFNKHTSENVFHVFILGMIVGLRDRYIIQSNVESGIGRLDAVLIPKDPKKYRSILLEFKTAKTPEELKPKAEEALSQIDTRKYFTITEQHEATTKPLKLGLAFCGKEVEIAWG